jgi:hypothetical protein
VGQQAPPYLPLPGCTSPAQSSKTNHSLCLATNRSVGIIFAPVQVHVGRFAQELWQTHRDLNERQERWTSDALDPRTAKLLGKLGPMILHMNTKILSPAKFSTMK